MATCKYCNKAAFYVVSRHQGPYYAVRITERGTPLYCEEHAHEVADRRALRVRDGTSAHITLRQLR